MIELGVVETGLTEHITDEEASEAISALLEIERPQPEDIAAAIVYAVIQPERVGVNEVLIRPTQQAN